MEEKFRKKFNECPVCALKKWLIEKLGIDEVSPMTRDRFFGMMSDEVKLRGWGRSEWTFNMDARTGIVMDKKSFDSIPAGAALPSYQVTTDICMTCGCVHAKEIARAPAQEKLQLYLPDDPLNQPLGRG